MDPSQGKTESSSCREPDKAWSSAAPVEEMVEWIVTLKPASGIIVKIEKLYSESGARQELSIEEYGTLAAMGAPVIVPGMPASADALPVTDISQVYYQAYYQGVYGLRSPRRPLVTTQHDGGVLGYPLPPGLSGFGLAERQLGWPTR